MLHELLQELQFIQELEGLYPAGTARTEAQRHSQGRRPHAGAGQVTGARRSQQRSRAANEGNACSTGTGGKPSPPPKEPRRLRHDSFENARQSWRGRGLAER